MMHKGTFPRANRSAQKRTLSYHRAETLRAEKMGALSDPPVSTTAVVSPPDTPPCLSVCLVIYVLTDICLFCCAVVL